MAPRLLTRAVVVAFGLLATAVPAAVAQAPLAPSLTADLSFAPAPGVSRVDFTPGTVADLPAAVAVHGGRIYTVGRTQGGTGGQDIGIIAQRLDGTLDPGFSGDGKLIVAVAPGTEADVGTGIAVLPDGRIRIAGATDRVAGSAESLDVVLLGFNPDGSPDTTFGEPDSAGSGRTGRIIFAPGPSSDVPARIAIGPDGRIAVVGSRNDGVRDDSFVSLREADGTAVGSFGTNGVRFVNRGGVVGGSSLIDRGIDVEFRPGGGLVALLLVETNPGAGNDFAAVLHAFRSDGEDDPAFSGDGDLVLAVGEPDTVPGGLIVHRGRLWISGYTRVGADTDAFLARVNADGSALDFRRFDMRGRLASRQVVSRALDLVVVPGEPATLVTVGSIDYTSDSGASITDWAAAAFNDFEGELARAGYGDLVLPAPGQGSLLSAAAGGDGWLAVAGTHVDTSIADNSFGTARLLVDADKSCDLAISVAEPAELVFHGTRSAALATRVTNTGTRACGGTVSVPAPYRIAPLATGVLAPGATFTGPPVPVVYEGPRRTEDVLVATVTAPRDANATNDRAAAHVVFSFCDLSATAVGAVRAIPSEGARRFELTLRNLGTAPCRVRLGSATPYLLQPGRSVTDHIAVAAPRGARVGARVAVALRASADDDVQPENNEAIVSPTVVRVGDSAIRRSGARAIAGTASKGAGALRAAMLRPARVDVAVLRLGGRGCSWLKSGRGGFATRAAPSGGCQPTRWIRARGTSKWRLSLRRALPRGRYVVFSRVTIRAGFAEAEFSRRDRNRLPLRIR